MRVSFGDFVLDRGARQLRRGEETRRLGPKAFELLELLLDHRPNVVPRRLIRDRLWPGTFVAESTLATVVAELRAALGEDAKQPGVLRTVHAVGFAFCGQASESRSRREGPGSAVAYRLVLKDCEIALGQGENLLGRVADGVAWLESPTVSRRHARIVIDGAGVVLEDLASKNGTFLHGRRITAPAVLADGDSFRLGRVGMTLRVVEPDLPTKTDDED